MDPGWVQLGTEIGHVLALALGGWQGAKVAIRAIVRTELAPLERRVTRIETHLGLVPESTSAELAADRG